MGAAVLADVLDNTVRDPEQIQQGLKTEVLGSLPVVKSLARPAACRRASDYSNAKAAAV